LNEKNFEETVHSGQWFVQIGAPWCRYCQELKETLEEFGLSMKSQNISVASLDGSRAPRIVRKYNVKGYPEFKFFSNGKEYNYKGERNVLKFTDFVTQGYQHELIQNEFRTVEDRFTKLDFDIIAPFKRYARMNLLQVVGITAVFSFVLGCLLGRTVFSSSSSFSSSATSSSSSPASTSSSPSSPSSSIQQREQATKLEKKKNQTQR